MPWLMMVLVPLSLPKSAAAPVLVAPSCSFMPEATTKLELVKIDAPSSIRMVPEPPYDPLSWTRVAVPDTLNVAPEDTAIVPRLVNLDVPVP